MIPEEIVVVLRFINLKIEVLASRVQKSYGYTQKQIEN
jgi:hypothetical protein